MKTVLGLDLGTTSIGWAIVREGEGAEIINAGVRVTPLSVDERLNFEKGRPITTNADRTLKRSMRRGLQRYKLRRAHLTLLLEEAGLIQGDSLLNEHGNHSTFETYRLRAKAARERVDLEELAKVLLMLNKKRGYKSNRKAKGEDEGKAIDGMAVARELYEKEMTPGEFAYALLKNDKRTLPDFYRSDLQQEFERIWSFQQQFHTDFLTEEKKLSLSGKSGKQTTAIFVREWKTEPLELDGKFQEKKLKRYELRAKAYRQRMDLGALAVVFSEINDDINKSSGYLGEISDRSKELYFNKQTVGEYLQRIIETQPHARLKGMVFYRQDYLDEFEQIWETQASFHPQLTPELKAAVRDTVIFYQRRLKSQKGLLSVCTFENMELVVNVEGKPTKKLVGPKVCPKSAPLFQLFRTLTQLNNLEFTDKDTGKTIRQLDPEERALLLPELSLQGELSQAEMKKLVGFGGKVRLNYEKLDGNRTADSFMAAYQRICELSGHDDIPWKKLSAREQVQAISGVFETLGINPEVLPPTEGSDQVKKLTESTYFRLWHLLYSYEGDNSVSGIDSLLDKLHEKYGFEREYAKIVASITFEPDYSSLSTKAIRKILPFLLEGEKYDEACSLAGYNHSDSKTTEELDNKVLADRLDLLPKNSLRNPVVEKILNQMINVVNEIMATYGRPDEIRIELARELKKSAKERKDLTQMIDSNRKYHEEITELLRKEFGIRNPSRNDIIRYKLYSELKDNGYKTLYSNTYIPKEKLFSAEIDIEHIIPQAKLFDDSYSNKTLEYRQVNIKKGNATAFDFVLSEYGKAESDQYSQRVKALFCKPGKMGKYKKLLWQEKDIPDDFINRDLQDTRYISKKAKGILESIVRTVTVTTGSVTDRLREDWGLMEVLKELNFPKFKAMGLVWEDVDRDGNRRQRIKDWTKRNDHRHHAVDAITVAFTKPSLIQYLNNLNARSDKNGIVYAIQQKETIFDQNNKRRIKPPIPREVFRAQVKDQLERLLVSIKAKNKVTTVNRNKIRTKKGIHSQWTATPRAQLHNESVYGSSMSYVTKEEKVNATFDADKITTVAKRKYREALMARLQAFGNDPKKAFTGKNTLDKNPIYLDEHQMTKVPEKVRTVTLEQRYTIRKKVDKDLRLDKVVDAGVRRKLEERLAQYGNDAAKAFGNLVENPIFLNEEKGITIQTVRITGVSNAIPLHTKKDHFGRVLLDEDGREIPTDFVSPSNNHHVAIYRDGKGNIQEEVVSFMEAVLRKNAGLPVVNRQHPEDWEFLFTLKQNEYFVFPDERSGFDPAGIDLLNPGNFAEVSPRLFRVQKIATRMYYFRHHLETTLGTEPETRDTTWKRIQTPAALLGAIKVRLDVLGRIISVGEYW